MQLRRFPFPLYQLLWILFWPFAIVPVFLLNRQLFLSVCLHCSVTPCSWMLVYVTVQGPLTYSSLLKTTMIRGFLTSPPEDVVLLPWCWASSKSLEKASLGLQWATPLIFLPSSITTRRWDLGREASTCHESVFPRGPLYSHSNSQQSWVTPHQACSWAPICFSLLAVSSLCNGEVTGSLSAVVMRSRWKSVLKLSV